jgi:hypothetical protein
MASLLQLGLLRLGLGHIVKLTVDPNSRLGLLRLGKAMLGAATFAPQVQQAGTSAQLGRLQLGMGRLGDAYVLFNKVVQGAVACNGAATALFSPHQAFLGHVHANGAATCVFTAGAGSGSISGSFACNGAATFALVITGQGFAGAFECDGVCGVIFISAGGAVAITCIDTGSLGSGGPALGAIDALYDLPYTY